MGGKGSGGHNALSAEVKKARGTLKKSREAKKTGLVAADGPVNTTPPSWLTQGAKAEWKRVVPLLDESKLRTEADRTALGNYCAAVHRAQQAEKEVEETGMTVINPMSGALRAHPLINVAKEARAQALRYACEFGLTPASRGKLGAPAASDKPDADPLSAFLGKPKLELVNGSK